MKASVLFALCLTSSLVAPSLQIIGGHDVKEGEYPYQVSVRGCITDICQHACGGTILNKRWILTAARCIKPYPSIFYKVNVLVGSLNMFIPDNDSVIIEVANTTLHPQYNSTDPASPYNLALLHLQEDIVFNKVAQPLKLPAAGSQPTGNAVLSGWGSIANPPNEYTPPIKPLKLQAVNVTIVTYKDCYVAIKSLYDASIDIDKKRNICTGSVTGQISLCDGDAGGPLVQNETVIGVAAWGLHPCGIEGAPSVYINTVAFLDWIDTVINKA